PLPGRCGDKSPRRQGLAAAKVSMCAYCGDAPPSRPEGDDVLGVNPPPAAVIAAISSADGAPPFSAPATLTGVSGESAPGFACMSGPAPASMAPSSAEGAAAASR